jgi:hypothetical protein
MRYVLMSASEVIAWLMFFFLLGRLVATMVS